MQKKDSVVNLSKIPDYYVEIDDAGKMCQATNTFCKDICKASEGHNCPAIDNKECHRFNISLFDLFVDRDSKMCAEIFHTTRDFRERSFELNSQSPDLVKLCLSPHGVNWLMAVCKLPKTHYSALPF